MKLARNSLERGSNVQSTAEYRERFLQDFFARIHHRRSRTPSWSDSSLWHCLAGRQTEMKTRAASIGVLGANGSAMCLDDRAHDGKTHSESFFFSAEELLKKPLPHFLRDPTTMVAHRDGDRAVAIVIRRNLQHTLARRRVTHRIKSIAHEVKQHLLNLGGIAVDRRQISRKGHLHLAEVCRGIWANHIRGRCHHVIQIDPAANRAALFYRTVHVTDDVTGVATVTNHVGENPL